MLWVTRSKIRVNRAATAWLVRRFVDPLATFCFVEPEAVARVQVSDGAIGFDAPGATYPHQDSAGRCSFEVLVEEHRPEDRALRTLARIVHGADFPEEVIGPAGRHQGFGRGTFDTISPLLASRGLRSTGGVVPEAGGLRAIAQGFPLVAGDDQETLVRSGFLYDALYASIQDRLGG